MLHADIYRRFCHQKQTIETREKNKNKQITELYINRVEGRLNQSPHNAFNPVKYFGISLACGKTMTEINSIF